MSAKQRRKWWLPVGPNQKFPPLSAFADEPARDPAGAGRGARAVLTGEKGPQMEKSSPGQIPEVVGRMPDAVG